MTVTEQALVEAMHDAIIAASDGYYPETARLPFAREVLAALRAALPENTVLTYEGLARVERRNPRDLNPPPTVPLYTLTLENET